MPRGELSDSALLLLTSERLPALLTTLRQTYDYLIIDAPSLGLAQDALLLAPHVDISLLVVNAGEQASRIRDAQHRLQAAAPTPVATMLNRVQEENLETQEGKRLPERGMGELISPK